jgi:hypothetical protein
MAARRQLVDYSMLFLLEYLHNPDRIQLLGVGLRAVVGGRVGLAMEMDLVFPSSN